MTRRVRGKTGANDAPAAPDPPAAAVAAPVPPRANRAPWGADFLKFSKNFGFSIFQLPGCYPGPWAVGKAPGGSWHEFSPRGVQIRARGTELCSFL